MLFNKRGLKHIENMDNRTKWRLKCVFWLAMLCYLVAFTAFYYAYTHSPAYKARRAIPTLPSVQTSLRVLELYRRKTYHRTRSDDTRGRGIGYLKVHKAASTTAQSIFLRYGWNRNLTFILPPAHNRYGYPNIISTDESLRGSNVLPPPANRSYDILCHHVLYNRQAWNKYLPAHAPKIGIIRDPFETFQSVLRYFRPGSIFKINSTHPVKTFLQNPLYYDNQDIRYSFLNNRMALEYGVDQEIILKRNMAKFELYMNEVLDKDFAVVIVVEMFDESLVFMKRKLNWSLSDILYVGKNHKILWSNTGKFTVEQTKEMRELHMRYAIFDYILYDFFKKRLIKQISEETGFQDEVMYFKSVKKQITDFCTRHGNPTQHLWDAVTTPRNTTWQKLSVNASLWNDPFEISVMDCFLLFATELEFTHAVRERQYGHAYTHIKVAY